MTVCGECGITTTEEQQVLALLFLSSGFSNLSFELGLLRFNRISRLLLGGQLRTEVADFRFKVGDASIVSAT
ncbi:MAG: hypothetical protein EB071_01535 [Gammaproteobacteria bacterium]|nr:hypothetical protein [Gammaproteobacteria bacterium]